MKVGYVAGAGKQGFLTSEIVCVAGGPEAQLSGRGKPASGPGQSVRDSGDLGMVGR